MNERTRRPAGRSNRDPAYVRDSYVAAVNAAVGAGQHDRIAELVTEFERERRGRPTDHPAALASE